LDDELLKQLINHAQKHNRKIYVPSGAIVGIDNIKSASLGKIYEVTLTTRKPAKSFEDTHAKLKLDKIKQPTLIYEGAAREAVKLFPTNINVAATLSLAGIGPDKTKVKIIADPTIEDIIHEIHVKGEFGEIETKTISKPFPRNPRTSYIAALSAIATLKKLTENLVVGT
ncbi:MAG: aspartate dehydrogenase domain-containing protein, partial [Candidatus Bathyarchaeia archaeon]